MLGSLGTRLRRAESLRSRRPREPNLVPRLRLHFADFPYLHAIAPRVRGCSPWRPVAVISYGRARHRPSFSPGFNEPRPDSPAVAERRATRVALQDYGLLASLLRRRSAGANREAENAEPCFRGPCHLLSFKTGAITHPGPRPKPTRGTQRTVPKIKPRRDHSHSANGGAKARCKNIHLLAPSHSGA